MLKSLNACGDMSGRDLSEQHAMPFRLLEPLLQAMKHAQLVAFRGSAPMNDYVYQLTDLGRERAKKFTEHCTLLRLRAGAAGRLHRQRQRSRRSPSSIRREDDLQRAFEDLLINKNMLRRLGPAINSGRGLFLFGAPGNGKTSIAERITKAFGDCIWIPRAIGDRRRDHAAVRPGHARGDAAASEPTGLLDNRKIDQRWVRIRRPTIVVGGELTMDHLEVTLNTATNVSEAPLQLKSNCGTLVIDDFGRQRMTTDELLNRWIVPLEKRYDFLQPGQRQEDPGAVRPADHLLDEPGAEGPGRRRVPAAYSVQDRGDRPDRRGVPRAVQDHGAEAGRSSTTRRRVDYLIEKHYQAVNRPFRCCQPRDLLLQIRNYCRYMSTCAGDDAGVFRLRGRELLRGDVAAVKGPEGMCRFAGWTIDRQSCVAAIARARLDRPALTFRTPLLPIVRG